MAITLLLDKFDMRFNIQIPLKSVSAVLKFLHAIKEKSLSNLFAFLSKVGE